ncbi:MAG: hypothetical protein JXQ73_22965 [Phycisphaerae bacterium]|nr:hypothetical protein [Phycisphaerae bacterium]
MPVTYEESHDATTCGTIPRPCSAVPATIRPVLQTRWRLERDGDAPMLVYYGLRNDPRHAECLIPISEATAETIRGFDGRRSIADLCSGSEVPEELRSLIEEGIVVDAARRKRPATAETKQTCVTCVNDDLILPGLEFDDRGLCAFCQCYEKGRPGAQSSVNTLTDAELLDAARANTASRFDVMVLYTGGKDSSFLLWYLARKLQLRVLAAFWCMPYTNPSSLENIRRAKARLPEVEFIERTVAWNAIKQAMIGQWRTVGVPCLCPTVAFALFYPLAFHEKVPFVLSGMEDVQLAVMDYVLPKPSPAAAAPRTPPSPRAHTLQFLELRTGDCHGAKPLRWAQELANYHASIKRQLNPLYGDLMAVIDLAKKDPAVSIPLIKRLDTTAAYGNWQDAVQIVRRELDWQMPPDQEGLLHTSCAIEHVKDYTQYMRFRNMRTTFFPQSITELSASVYFGLTSRDEALRQRDELGYLRPPAILADLLKDLDITDTDVDASEDELRHALRASSDPS